MWGDRIAKTRGKRIAAIAVARKLAGVLWAMWRDGTAYDPGAHLDDRRDPEETRHLEAGGPRSGAPCRRLVVDLLAAKKEKAQV
jgi:hypothetical protein